MRGRVEETGEFLITGVPAEPVLLHAIVVVDSGPVHMTRKFDARRLENGDLGDVRVEHPPPWGEGGDDAWLDAGPRRPK